MKQRNLSFQVTNEKVETAILKSVCYYLTFTALNESAQSIIQQKEKAFISFYLEYLEFQMKNN